MATVRGDVSVGSGQQTLFALDPRFVDRNGNVPRRTFRRLFMDVGGVDQRFSRVHLDDVEILVPASVQMKQQQRPNR